MRCFKPVMATLGILVAGCNGCGDSGLKPAVSRAKFEEIKQEETSGERKLLENLEKKFGPNHPQVIQMKMELGITPQPDAGNSANK